LKAAPRESLKRLAVLMATVFVDMVGFSMVLTQLPFYAERFGASPTLIGLLISAFALAQLTTAPLWGRFSDRYGRRPAILSGLCASAVAFLLFGLASLEPVIAFFGTAGSLWVLLASRLAQGAGGGTVGVVQAYVSDSSSREERSKVLGWVTAATSAGVMIGPAIGSLAFRLGPAAPGYAAAALCLTNVAFAWRWLPESFPEHPERERVRPSVRRALAAVVRHPGLPVSRLIWVYAMGMLAFMSLNGVLVLYLERVFGITEESIGWFYAYVASVTLVMRALLLGPIVRRFGEPRTLRLGALSVALGLLLIPFAYNIPTLGLVALFIPVGTALLFPVTTSLVSQRFASGETGQALGVQQAFGGLARLAGPVWATIVFERVGITAPFWIAGALMIAVRLFAGTIRGPEEDAPEAAGLARPDPGL
jgi:MFS family permease